MQPPAPAPRTDPTRLGALGLALLALAAVCVHAALMLRHAGSALFTFYSAEYAIAGRTLIETGRLATLFVHPAFAGRVGGPPFPLIAGHPLQPMLESIVFLLGGPRPELSVLPAALAFILLVPLTAALAWRVSRSRGLALLAGVAVALNGRALRYATEGTSEMVFTVLFTAALVLLWDLRERPRPLLLGIVLGLAHLARPVVVPLLPAWLLGIWWLSPARDRVRTGLVTLAAFVPFAAALTLYKWASTGDPSLDASYLVLTGMEPGFTMQRLNRSVPVPDPSLLLSGHPLLLVRKVVETGPPLLIKSLIAAGRAFALPVVILLLAPRRPVRLRRFAWVVVGLLLLLTGISAMTVAITRLAFPLLPVLVVFGLEGGRRLLAGARWPVLRRLALPACAAFVLALVVAPSLLEWRRALETGVSDRTGYRESEWRGLVSGLTTLLPEHGVVACDAAPWISWYAGLPTTQIPADPSQLATLQRLMPVAAVVVTDEWVIRQPGEEAWRQWFRGDPDTPGWVGVGRVRSGRLEAMVYLPVRPPIVESGLARAGR